MDSLRQSEGFYSQQQSLFTSVLASRVNGCNQLDAKGKHHDIPLDNHFKLLNLVFVVWLFFFCTESRLFFKFWELDHLLFEAKFRHVLMSAWSLFYCHEFCTLPYFYRWSGDRLFFFLPLMLNIFHVWNLMLCRLPKIKQCHKIFNLKENRCANWHESTEGALNHFVIV